MEVEFAPGEGARQRTASRHGTEEWVSSVHGPGRALSRQKSALGDDDGSPLRSLTRGLTPPCYHWLARYSRADLHGDLIAGLTVSVVLVPQAVAYSMLADMPAVHGLYTSFVPLLVFAAFTTSRHTSVGPFALMSIVTRVLAQDVVGMDAPRETHVAAVLCISVTAGAVQLAMGLLGLGLGAAFLSSPSVAGFTTASALIIACSQLQHLLGVPIPSGSLPVRLAAAGRATLSGQANGWAAALAAGALCFMLGAKALGARCCPRVPLFEQLGAVVLCTLLAEWARLPVPRVGDEGAVPSGLPSAALPAFGAFSLAENLSLLQAGFTAGLTSFLLSVSIARTFALQKGYAVDASAELLALGLSNLAGGCFGAYPVCGSLSRSALCCSVGGRTPLHGVVQAGVVGLVLLGCTPLFAPLPYCVLAALIFAALASLLGTELPVRLWASSRADFGLWAVAFCGTALFGVQPGLALALGSSLSLLVARASRPQCEVLGRLPGTALFRDVRRYPAALCSARALVFRFGASLHFANADFFCARVREALRRRAAGAPASYLVLDCSAVCDVDYSANCGLCSLLTELREARVCVLLAAPRQALLERLRAFGSLGGPLLREEHVYVSVGAALEYGVGAAADEGGARAGGECALAEADDAPTVLRMLTLGEPGAAADCGRDCAPGADRLEAGERSAAAHAEPGGEAGQPRGLLRSASAALLGVGGALAQQLAPAMGGEARRGERSGRVPTREPSGDAHPFVRFPHGGGLAESSDDEEAADLRVHRSRSQTQPRRRL